MEAQKAEVSGGMLGVCGTERGRWSFQGQGTIKSINS